MYVSHAHCTHAATTEARRQCRRSLRGEEVELSVPSTEDEPPLRLKRLTGDWRDTYEMVDREGRVVGIISKVDYLEDVRTRRGFTKNRVTEYRMGFRPNVDPARRFEGQGSRKIHEALQMANRAYHELVGVAA